MSHAQFRGLSIDMGVGIAMMKIEKVVARQNSLQIFSETPVAATTDSDFAILLTWSTADEDRRF